MKKARIICKSAAVILLAAVIPLIGCAEQTEQPELPAQPVMVYDDGVYLIEADAPEVVVSGDGSASTNIQLKITNRSTEDLVISSVLGVRVSSPGTECLLVKSAEQHKPIDGLIRVGERAEGCISVETPVEPESFTVELAVGYLDDQWISFDISR